MTQPLSLLLHEKLLPGSQLVNRLQDLHYRVHAIGDAAALVACAESEGPMLVLVDLESSQGDVLAAVARLKQNPATQHIPVVAYVDNVTQEIETAARESGATLVASDNAMVNHLSQLLEQALRLDGV